MPITAGMSTLVAMSTTTTRPVRIRSPRLRDNGLETITHSAIRPDCNTQGTEIPA